MEATLNICFNMVKVRGKGNHDKKSTPIVRGKGTHGKQALQLWEARGLTVNKHPNRERQGDSR